MQLASAFSNSIYFRGALVLRVSLCSMKHNIYMPIEQLKNFSFENSQYYCTDFFIWLNNSNTCVHNMLP